MSSSVSLVCHFFYSSSCNKQNCSFPHGPNPSIGYCPNGFGCPIRHIYIDCPILESKGNCDIQNCTYNHYKFLKKYESNPLACHFFHSNLCHKKNCKFLHEPNPSEGYCPNGFRCPIKHKELDCPVLLAKGDCHIQRCSFSHQKSSKKQEKVKTHDNSQKEQKEPLFESEIKVEKVKINDELSQQELLRHLKELNKDINSLVPVENTLKVLLELDVMFIMDCTGSMASWIDASKKELKNIISCITEQHQGLKIRISFVAYRDFCDGKKLQYEIQDFTENIDSVRKFIERLNATGGGDECEDVAGGLSNALQQSWRAKTKYAVFIADSPAHGKNYHVSSSDDYPMGDPNGRKIEDLITQFAKNDINLYMIKITNSTDKMFKIMADVYQKTGGKKLQIADLGHSTKCFGFFITCTINSTITQTILREKVVEMHDLMKNLQKNRQNLTVMESEEENKNEEVKREGSKPKVTKKELNLEFSLSNCDWNKTEYTEFKAVCHTWFIVKDKNMSINWRKPLIQKSQINTFVWIESKPFAAGAMRFAFYMKDTELHQKLVAKIPKVLDESYNMEVMMKDIESLFICNHIVNEFNDRVVSLLPDPDMLISFVHCFIYEIMDPKCPYKYWWVENFIEKEFEKFNNNAGWETSSFKQTSLIAQALSHFSWQFTNGFLMIVDLQGGTGILTDPQIHCLDTKRFGKGNLGYEGIVKFFFTHKCNFYCQKLGLLHPRETIELPKEFNFYQDIVEKPKKDEQINKLCDLCRKAYKIGAWQYYENRQKYPEMYCSSCKIEKNCTIKEGVCVDCGAKFKSSEFWFKMKRTDFPVKCQNCRLINRNKLRKELEREGEGVKN